MTNIEDAILVHLKKLKESARDAQRHFLACRDRECRAAVIICRDLAAEADRLMGEKK